jgi:hypothetical protein
MNKLLLIIPLLFCVLNITAQESGGNVVVNKDPRLDLLINKQIEINEVTTRNSRRSTSGFRILVISSNDRNKVIDVKTKMYRQFPELKAYMMYQSPFFRLKVGNFRERAEAEEYLSSIQRLVEGNVYIVPDTIEIRLGSDN